MLGPTDVDGFVVVVVVVELLELDVDEDELVGTLVAGVRVAAGVVVVVVPPR